MTQGCIQNQAVAPVSYYTLNRIEHLRRSVLKALARIDGQNSQRTTSAITDQLL